MSKRKTRSTTNNSVTTKATTGRTPPNNIEFPELSTKKGLECRVLLGDQITLIDNLFSADECKRFVKFIDELPLELTPPKKRGEAERVNHRVSVISPDFAARLFDVIGPHLPNFPYPASVATKARATARAGHSLNSNIRMYKYTPNQHFGPHYDDAVVDPSGSGSRSEWTLLIYLTGIEDGVKGGETVFYLDNKMKKQVKAPLNRGTALLHRHGHECLLHEGSRVESGTKYVEMSFKRGNFTASFDLLHTTILDGMHQPLLQAFPEYCVVKHPHGIREFKVESKDCFRSRNASSLYYSGLLDWAVVLVFPILGAIVWQTAHNWVLALAFPVFLIPFGYWKATRVLWETVIVLPSKDLQLEVHRGLPGLPMFVERRVILASAISAVIINEGLYGWNVRYYLAVLTKVDETQSLYVLYENQLPRMPVLRDVYHNLQVLLFDES